MDTAHRMHPSDEATREGLKRAREAGEAYRQMVEYFIAKVAKRGAMREAGDFRVGVAVEDPEPLWHPNGAELVLGGPPAHANLHLEVVALDADDGRFIPELEVVATLIDEKGNVTGSWDLPFLWHPTMFHYGRNVSVPRPAAYTVRVAIAMPVFFRHDKENGKRYRAPVVVDFPGFGLDAYTAKG